MNSGKVNKARNTLWPNNQNILVRVAFLYVGQGAALWSSQPMGTYTKLCWST